MKSSSTTPCLVSFLDFLYSYLNKRNTSLAIAFVDFRKAFDLVDHTVAITKAISMGIPPYLIAWMADFLSGCWEAVRYQGCLLPPTPDLWGHQGTKMDPLCFLMMINDAFTDTPHRWKYMDNSTLGIPVPGLLHSSSHLRHPTGVDGGEQSTHEPHPDRVDTLLHLLPSSSLTPFPFK